MGYVFEYEGNTVEYLPATVAARLTRGRIINKLMQSHNYVVDNPGEGQAIVTDEEWDNFLEYAGHLSQSKAETASWWRSEHTPAHDIKEAYDTWLNADAELFDVLRQARRAVEPTKKTTSSTQKTS